jgi:hypothetical protein
MARIAEVTGDDLKAQLNEYHVIVAEVIGGLVGDLTSQDKRITDLEASIHQMVTEIRELKEANRVLAREVLALKRSGPVA